MFSGTFTNNLFLGWLLEKLFNLVNFCKKTELKELAT